MGSRNPSHFQHHIYKKFRIVVGSLCRAVVFFRYCGDGSKPDSIPAVLCGAVAVLTFSHLAVKAVGGNDIQVAVTDLCGQAEIPLA